mgnify:CR=1 FL=1
MRKGVAQVMKVAAGVRLVCFDVDGVVNDGGFYYLSEEPSVAVRFWSRDGHGFQLLREVGIQIAWVSGNRWPAVQARAERLLIPHLFLGTADKAGSVRYQAGALGIPLGQVAYVGDDVNDLPAMALVGLPIAVADADWEVRARATYVTKAPGGHGAAREVADLILAAKRGAGDG